MAVFLFIHQQLFKDRLPISENYLMRERLGVHLPNCQGCVLRECEDLSVLMWRAMDVTGISMKNSPRTKNCQMRSSGKRATN
ncbi:hypothetical protein U0070_026511, partial [Myodes glareolus]